MQEVLRFVAGGLVVSMFAVLGDSLKPKSFAGLFGAAPSVALASLTLAVIGDGRRYAAIEGRSLIAGAVGLTVYALVCSYLMIRCRWRAFTTTSAAIVLWFAASLSIWWILLR